MLKAFTPSLEVLRRTQKLGVLLLQLSPAFSPRKHDVAELEDVLELTRDYRVAIELRNRNWAEGEQLQKTLDFMRKQKQSSLTWTRPTEKHFTIMPSDLDAITNKEGGLSSVTWSRSRAYITGKTVAARFDYDYNEKEIADVAERSRKFAKEARELHVISRRVNVANLERLRPPPSPRLLRVGW